MNLNVDQKHVDRILPSTLVALFVGANSGAVFGYQRGVQEATALVKEKLTVQRSMGQLHFKELERSRNYFVMRRLLNTSLRWSLATGMFGFLFASGKVAVIHLKNGRHDRLDDVGVAASLSAVGAALTRMGLSRALVMTCVGGLLGAVSYSFDALSDRLEDEMTSKEK